MKNIRLYRAPLWVLLAALVIALAVNLAVLSCAAAAMAGGAL